MSSVVVIAGLNTEDQYFVNEELKWLFSAAEHFQKVRRGEIDRQQPVALPIPPHAEQTSQANNQLLSNLDEFDLKIWERQIESGAIWRAPYAQPIVHVGYRHDIPEIISPITNFFVCTMAQIYPHDRQLSNGVVMARKTAEIVNRYLGPPS